MELHIPTLDELAAFLDGSIQRAGRNDPVIPWNAQGHERQVQCYDVARDVLGWLKSNGVAVGPPPQDMRERAKDAIRPHVRPDTPVGRGLTRDVEALATTAHAEGRAAQRREDAEIARSFLPKRKAQYRGRGGLAHAREANMQAKAAQHERIQTINRIAAAIEGTP